MREGRIVLRSFGETLRELYPAGELQNRLVEAFSEGEDENERRSVIKKVRNWLTDQSRPTGREDIFRIAFALGISDSQASYLLGMCTDSGIHYRDGRESIYAWFLRAGHSYLEAKEFYESLPPIIDPESIPPQGTGMQLTRELQEGFLSIHDLTELREYYEANLESFGSLHLRAYAYFSKYMGQLIRPEPGWEGDEEADYSVEAVMEHYFSLHMPSGRGRSGYSAVQKLIKNNWPNATALKNIRGRRMDVPRKLLLLLYVVTENIVDGDYSELDEDYITPQERLETHWWTLNAILTDCGMPTLDPRNPTDWLVLYSLAADEESMSERMEQVIEKIYED